MRTVRTFAQSLAVVALSASLAFAQPPAPGGPPFETLLHGPFTQSSFTFDRTMLQAADGFFSGSDPDTRRVIAGLNSITVRNFHTNDWLDYDRGAMGSLEDSYRSAGWKHLVNANANKDTKSTTDLWLHFQGADIVNVTVLTRGDRNMSVVAVDCHLRPLDLLHLSGHFGIPKVDENAVMVPAPR